MAAINGKRQEFEAGSPCPTETPPLTAKQMAMISPAQEMTQDIEHIPGPTGTHPGAPSLQAVEAMAAACVELAKSHPELIP
eukprot:5844858-Pyramimonas_sp.AAC.1